MSRVILPSPEGKGVQQVQVITIEDLEEEAWDREAEGQYDIAEEGDIEEDEDETTEEEEKSDENKEDEEELEDVRDHFQAMIVEIEEEGE